jgi:chemotaxis response regulator CheB
MLTEKGARTTMDALAAGAVSIITKPKIGVKQFLLDSCDDLVAAVKVAAQAKVHRLRVGASVSPEHKDVILPAAGDRTMVNTLRAGDRNRHLNRWYAGAGGGADNLTESVARYHHRATHAGEIHRSVRRPPERPLPDRGQGSTE